MQSLVQPELLLKPFAENGDKNSIPLENQTIAQPQLADLTSGFPPITSLDPADGGLPPERKDFNALGFLTTSYDFFYQAGGTFTFSSTISNAIGGYPLGARLWYTDANGVSMIVRSTIENNTNNFISNPSYIGEVGESKPWVVENFRGIKTQYGLFDFKWQDYELTDMNWLRADTFSWQDGTVYSNAYLHLYNDIQDVTSSTETIGSYTITYYKAEDGHKIVMDDQETTVQNIYSETGVAWYYILDTANQRFKLPRTKFGFMGVRDGVGNYIAPGVPNITGNVAKWNNGLNLGVSGAFYVDGSSSGTRYLAHSSDSPNQTIIRFSASRSNSLYGASNTIQPPATQMYLYFYVGPFSQSAIEQTAGLNTGLFNGKVDIDSSWGFPSATYKNLTLLASGQTYTAPANGYFYLSRLSGGGTTAYMNIVNVETQISSENYSASTKDYVKVWLPVKRGDVVSISYSTYYTTTQYFRFIYAVGSESGAS